MFEHLLRDVRYSLRSLRRSAGFTAFAVLIAGLGIGASATVFSVVNALLLRPLPFTEPDRLVWITNQNAAGLSGQTTQVDHMLDLGERSLAIDEVAGYFAFYGVGDNVLTGRGEPERFSGVPVSANFFDVLGVSPYLGRTFNADESRWQGPGAVMLSYAVWERRFLSDPNIVGESITLNDAPHLVVGVLPRSFDFSSIFAPGSRIDLVLPFPLTPETNRWGNTMAMVGRLRPGASIDEAGTEVARLGVELTRDDPTRNSFGGFVEPLSDHVRGPVRLAIWVLAGAVGAVMLIVCANLSNLLLARSAMRHRELAIRAAMGAGRRRLVAQMVVEGLVLSGSGAVLGLALAIGGTRAVASIDAISLPLLRDVRADATTLAVMVVLTLATGIVFGLVSAIRTPDAALHDALKDSARGSTEGQQRRWVQRALVVSEIAFACVLVVGAGLLVRSLVRVLDVDLGFEPASAMTIRVDPDSRYTTSDERGVYFDDVLRRVRALSGVEAAGITDALPLGRNRTWGARADGVTYEPGTAPSAFVRIVSDGYTAAMGIALRAGRGILPSDTADTEPVIVVNASMASTLWPGQDPIDQHVVTGCGGSRRVVGVVDDVRHLALEQTSGSEMYIPMRQCQDLPSADLVVRASGTPAVVATAVRASLAPVAANLAGNRFSSIQERVDVSVSPRRFMVVLLGGFAAFALVLASLGVYALISYSVSQRTQEIGIRMALGASTRDVQGRVLGETIWLVAAGLGAGALASWLAAQTLRGLLFEVTASDPVTFALMTVVLSVVALVAGYLPARRASRIDPLTALRAE